uniref:tRNA (guanine-N(7)-)-methyltransferase n=1 Tax=Favella ehrenbergii TaxID=182087 RepID=A0A7S3MS21_9SPIT|mmetsp:Transcript_3949/g.4723  ORF Transcript_3949/g.4723 Transcript_3949/m.4723 type:complete len:304 (+) Transcript_3949:63-974(+)|eukprot:CAMPEP_0170469450 /NCGR_PEP_ID=MMETSP0123-20130129/12275_1 /TAXON_ID=182087 /ORGANISM="Favella ehrenbergii, Strain Fehren 1" /LENGTH=303 /DNA_ID=CAMNT_0010736321 /DNA_START=63 /DNA_END=974 /DNA_ORIENTATION=-
MKRTAQEAGISSEGAAASETSPQKRVNMPKKNNHRMHAHINPFTPLKMPTPQNTRFADWSLHYPSYYGSTDNNKDRIVVNTKHYKIAYETEASQQDGPTPTVLDIGCGYGGLMFELTKIFKDELILGLEIRDKVANFAGEKINSLRINSGYKDCLNTAVLRTNAMKSLHNYFKKDSLEKMFFCFADPHFKKSNHRKRIVNTALLTDYCYMLRPGGKVYVVTDVEDLHNWQVSKLEEHPMFERVPEEEDQADPCVKAMREGTDEAQKVIRREGNIWHAVFKKRDVTDQAQMSAIEAEYMEKFFD